MPKQILSNKVKSSTNTTKKIKKKKISIYYHKTRKF